MKASIWLGKDKFEIKDVPIPEIMDDQVLVKVKKVGLCGTDVHILKVYFPQHLLKSWDMNLAAK